MRMFSKRFFLTLLLQLAVISISVLATYFVFSFNLISRNTNTLKNVDRVIPQKNLMVYTKYTDPSFKSSTGQIFIAELHKPASEQIIYDFKENDNQRISKLLGVADKKIFYLLHFPKKNSQELGYIDLLTSNRQVLAQPIGYSDDNNIFFDKQNKKVYYPAKGGLYVYDIALNKQMLLLASDGDLMTEDEVFVTFADSQIAYLLNIVQVGRDETVNSTLNLSTKKVEAFEPALIRPVFSEDGHKVAYFEDSNPDKYPTKRTLKIKYLNEPKVLDIYTFTYRGEGPIPPPTVVNNLAFSKAGNRFSFSVGTDNTLNNQYSYTSYVSLIEQYKTKEPNANVTSSPQGARSITFLPEFNEDTYKRLNKVEDIPHDYKWSVAYLPNGEVFAGSKQEAKIYTKEEITYLDLENAFLKYPLLIRARDLLFVADP